MRETAREFGDAAVVRHFCDRPGCGKPVTLLWKGRSGEYCSNNCLKLSERQGVNNKVTEATATVEMTDAPVTAGKTKEKKAKAKAKKAAPAKKAKKAAAKKVAAAASSNGTGRETVNTRRTIKLTKKKPEMRDGTVRQIVYNMIKNGMTVRELQEKAIKHFDDTGFMNRAVAILRWAEGEGLCTVSEG